MIIKDENILSKFKTEAYSKLSVKERRKLVTEFINAVIKEKNLSSIGISYKPGDFGYEPKNNTIYIDDGIIKDKSNNSNYVLLTGLIHELRHKEQTEKGDYKNLFYTGRTYALSPVEMDAHVYTSKELLQLLNFFKDDEFDKYVYILQNKDLQDIRTAMNYYLMCGYSSEEIPDICRKQAEYTSQLLTEPKDEKHGYMFANNKLYDTKTMSIQDFLMLQSATDIAQITKFPEKGITTIFVDKMRISVKNGQAYIMGITETDDISAKEILKQIQGALSFVNQYKIELDLGEISNVNFPPLGLIDDKEQKEKFYKALGIDNGLVDMQSIMAINPDEAILDDLIIKSFGKVSDVETYLKEAFGIDYKEKYSEEKQEFLASMIPYMETYAAYTAFQDEEDKQELGDGYFAIGIYKPEYSLEKLNLIFEAQKEGLNTMYYGKLTEEQIKVIMNKQREGVSREELLKTISSYEPLVFDGEEESII